MLSCEVLPMAALMAIASAQSLGDVCTTDYIRQSLPVDAFNGITFNIDSVTAATVYNASIASSNNYPAASGIEYCNVTLSYFHNGLNDTVLLWYHLPSPLSYKNRFLATGGGGESINSGESSLLQGSVYGAASGLTDGGFGGFNNDITSVLLKANGTLNYNALYAFAYTAIHEMTIIGKALSVTFYNSSDLHSYYFGCSEGGRDGWSQVQRYQNQFDGAVIGAPAFRQAYQQVNHLTAAVTETVTGYAPPYCELEKIYTDLLAACDLLDGKHDGVVSRTDLCKIQYDPSASLGKAYSCAVNSAAGASMSMGGGGGGAAGPPGGPTGTGGGSSASTPAQNGTVSAQGVALAKALLAGLHDSKGRQIYVPFQPSAPFDDAETMYDNATGQYQPAAQSIAVEWVNLYLREVDSSDLSLANVTHDTLRAWILEGLQKYSGTLETVWPDLEDFRAHGGKVIHFHGESDPSIPADSSVLYQESVRRTMYPGLSYNESYAQLDDWYRLYLIPGAAHCSPSSDQGNGPWPQSMLGSLIEWVEDGVNPGQLNATHLSGSLKGDAASICAFPSRPLWAGNTSDMQCVFDQAALHSWYPELDSIPISVY